MNVEGSVLFVGGGQGNSILNNYLKCGEGCTACGRLNFTLYRNVEHSSRAYQRLQASESLPNAS